jgi:di/tricarboxylate transporter
MTLNMWLSIGTVAVVLSVLIFSSVTPHLILCAAMVFLMAVGVLSPAEALKGFSNPGVIVIGSLYIVATSLQRTGLLSYFINSLLGEPRTVRQAIVRLGIPVMSASAFINNTTIVAMLTPAVKEWAQKLDVSSSKFLIPLSYFAIFGGMCTLIGSSTNLILNGILIENGHRSLELFELGLIGVPVAIMSLVYLTFFAPKLLVDRKQQEQTWKNDPRQFTLEMVVADEGRVAGKSIAEAGLRRLPGVYLMEIHRRDKVIRAVDPEEILEIHDQLVFVGQVDAISDLQKISGLAPSTNQVFKIKSSQLDRIFAEAVIARNSPLIGKTIKESDFRRKFNAVILGVSRSGEKIDSRIGDIKLEAGDSLFLETTQTFMKDYRKSEDFYLVNQLKTEPLNKDKASIAALIFLALVMSVVFGFLEMVQAAPIAALLVLAFRCISEEQGMKSLDVTLLIGIASSLALGEALTKSGAASVIAEVLSNFTNQDPTYSLILVYLATIFVTELITNNAALVIMLPIALSMANALGVSSTPFAIATWLAASCSLMIPMGYQTNLIVYGAGGYKLRDFIKIGFPLSLLIAALVLKLVPMIWRF